ncbi:hypothetical protein C8R46DRAFT_1239357 [Mycena filopes]|nr:hypothetical protein C8R46DRAFT_1239357 [Mycena filopes]
MGLTARVHRGADGNYFLVHTDTGMRIDVIDDENLPLPEDPSLFAPEPTATVDGGPSLSSESDMAQTQDSPDNNPARDLDDKIRGILEDLGPGILSQEHMAAINQMRGALSTGRERLFTTTAIVLDHQQENRGSHDALLKLRDEVADRLTTLHSGIVDRQTQLNNCVSANIKALRALGMSENLLGQILTSAAKQRSGKLERPGLPNFSPPETVTMESDLGTAINATVSPRRAGESLEEFGKRAEAVLNRKDMAAAAFSKPIAPHLLAPNVPLNPSTKPNARFEDPGSISSAFNRRGRAAAPTAGIPNSISHTGYLTANDGNQQDEDVFTTFRQETDARIADIVDKAVGEVLNLPSRIKSPKLDTPLQIYRY